MAEQKYSRVLGRPIKTGGKVYPKGAIYAEPGGATGARHLVQSGAVVEATEQDHADYLAAQPVPEPEAPKMPREARAPKEPDATPKARVPRELPKLKKDLQALAGRLKIEVPSESGRPTKDELIRALEAERAK